MDTRTLLQPLEAKLQRQLAAVKKTEEAIQNLKELIAQAAKK